MVFRVKCPKTILKDKMMEKADLSQLVSDIKSFAYKDDNLSENDKSGIVKALDLFLDIDPEDPNRLEKFILKLKELENETL